MVCLFKKKMAALKLIKTAKLITFMVFFSSFVHSSRTNFGVDQHKSWIKQDFERYGEFRRLGKVSWVKQDFESYGGFRRLGKLSWVKQDFESYGGFKSLGKGASDLAREVPSGPDPLHHNIDKPSRH